MEKLGFGLDTLGRGGKRMLVLLSTATALLVGMTKTAVAQAVEGGDEAEAGAEEIKLPEIIVNEVQPGKISVVFAGGAHKFGDRLAIDEKGIITVLLGKRRGTNFIELDVHLPIPKGNQDSALMNTTLPGDKQAPEIFKPAEGMRVRGKVLTTKFRVRIPVDYGSSPTVLYTGLGQNILVVQKKAEDGIGSAEGLEDPLRVSGDEKTWPTIPVVPDYDLSKLAPGGISDFVFPEDAAPVKNAKGQYEFPAAENLSPVEVKIYVRKGKRGFPKLSADFRTAGKVGSRFSKLAIHVEKVEFGVYTLSIDLSTAHEIIVVDRTQSRRGAVYAGVNVVKAPATVAAAPPSPPPEEKPPAEQSRPAVQPPSPPPLEKAIPSPVVFDAEAISVILMGILNREGDGTSANPLKLQTDSRTNVVEVNIRGKVNDPDKNPRVEWKTPNLPEGRRALYLFAPRQGLLTLKLPNVNGAYEIRIDGKPFFIELAPRTPSVDRDFAQKEDLRKAVPLNDRLHGAVELGILVPTKHIKDGTTGMELGLWVDLAKHRPAQPWFARAGLGYASSSHQFGLHSGGHVSGERTSYAAQMLAGTHIDATPLHIAAMAGLGLERFQIPESPRLPTGARSAHGYGKVGLRIGGGIDRFSVYVGGSLVASFAPAFENAGEPEAVQRSRTFSEKIAGEGEISAGFEFEL